MKLCSYNLSSVTLVIAIIFALGRVGESAKPNSQGGSLQVGFYKRRCPNKVLDIQAFIEAEVATQFIINPTLLAAFLRLQFHDCFVKGCDASILIAGAGTEMTAPANSGVRDFAFIDALKVKVEAICPGIVSCADIIAVATKTLLKQGGGPDYFVKTGRRDGTQSLAGDVKLPGPSMSVADSFAFFQAKNFSLEDMVVLLGCHTVGKARCQFFENRLYNDPGNTAYDPDMDADLRAKLIALCSPKGTTTNKAFLDQTDDTVDTFDASFYNQTVFKRGLLPLDQALATDPTTSTFVNNFVTSPGSFNTKLADVMVRLQAVDVLTGNQGNIRKVCSKFN